MTAAIKTTLLEALGYLSFILGFGGYVGTAFIYAPKIALVSLGLLVLGLLLVFWKSKG